LLALGQPRGFSGEYKKGEGGSAGGSEIFKKRKVYGRGFSKLLEEEALGFIVGH